MKKSILAVMCLFIMSILFGCSSYPEEYGNKNINTDDVSEQTPLSAINFYYGATEGLARQFDDPYFSKIVYSAYSTVNDISSVEAGSQTNTYFINSNVTNDDLNGFSVNAEVFGDNLSNMDTYSANGDGILKSVLSSLSSDSLSVIVSDLGIQLDDYSNLSRLIIDNVLAKDLSLAFIGVNSQVSPYFIIAVGKGDRISDYVSRFNEKPDVLEYYGESGTFQTNETRNINYEIFAQNNGILGIDYKNISFVENGIIRILEDDEIVMMKETVEDPETGERILVETDGSLTERNDEYTKDKLNVIEGTVNFGNISDERMLVRLRSPKLSKEERKENPDARLNPDDFTYLSAVSLVDNPALNLAGKIKLKIPFFVIEGVKLSALDCEIDSTIFTTNGKKFKEINESTDKYLISTVAEGTTPSQGKWRVDDKTNSLIFNILVNNAAVLPSSKKFIKLDVAMNHFATRESIPNWVTDWSKPREQTPVDADSAVVQHNAAVPNLHNLFDSLYAYQSQQNASVNSFTIYIADNSNLRER